MLGGFARRNWWKGLPISSIGRSFQSNEWHILGRRQSYSTVEYKKTGMVAGHYTFSGASCYSSCLGAVGFVRFGKYSIVKYWKERM